MIDTQYSYLAIKQKNNQRILDILESTQIIHAIKNFVVIHNLFIHLFIYLFL